MTQIRSLSGILLLLAAACGNPVTTPRAATATTVPSPPVAAASPALSVSASPSPQSYTCTDMSGGGGARANVVAVRAAAQDGFDRWVLEFDGPVPGYTITRQANASFTEDASGRSVTLDGADVISAGAGNDTVSYYGTETSVDGGSGTMSFTPPHARCSRQTSSARSSTYGSHPICPSEYASFR